VEDPLIFVEFLCSWCVAVLVGSLAEYAVHRLMHAGRVLKKRHAKHHRNLAGQGWWGEFTDYVVPGIAILWVGFLYSVPAGIGFAVGSVTYAAFAAYAHQLQHENPDLVFWLPRPVHYLHHRDNMWRSNFGISLDLWDRVFATYRVVEWRPEHPPHGYPLRRYLDIRWI
jgi:sterol desaturase/sphingolipid hydroxylase (fatty acid hydroxylase superfamily)